MGDSGDTDDDGPAITIGCKKDSTTMVGGKNALLGTPEVSATILLAAD